jgi:hypothetical protein
LGKYFYAITKLDCYKNSFSKLLKHSKAGYREDIGISGAEKIFKIFKASTKYPESQDSGYECFKSVVRK